MNNKLVKLKALYVGLCGSDINKLKQDNNPLSLIHDLGHEIVAEVIRTNGGFKKGDIVAVNPFVVHENCDICKYNSFNLCSKVKSLGKSLPGGFSVFFETIQASLYKLSDNKDLEVYTLADSIAVIINAIKYIKINKNNTYAIYGDGPIAVLLFVILDKIYNIKPILIIPQNSNRIINYLNIPTTNLKNLEKFDYVFECVGGYSPQSLEICLNTTKDCGNLLVLGAFNDTDMNFNLRKLFYRQIKIVGINSFCEGDYEKALQIITSLNAPLKNIITNIYPYENLEKVVSNILAKKQSPFLKIVFKI